jgi:hypothetical protein
MALCHVVNAGAAPAQRDPVDVFDSYRLLGTWSPDCTSNASQHNPRVTFQGRGGRLIHTVTFDGRKLALIDEVASATPIDATHLIFTVVRSNRLFATVTIRLEFGMLHIVKSVGADGRLTVDRGIDQSTGMPALVDERCEAAVS